MGKQLTCLLVMVLALVFVWADTGAIDGTSGVPPTISTLINSTVEITTSIPKNLQDTTPPPAPILGGIINNCDSLEEMFNCTTCVLNNCTFVQESYGAKCTNDSDAYDQFTLWISHTVEECPTTINTTTTTVKPETTTTTTTSTTPAPPTNSTTTTTPASTTTSATTTTPTTPAASTPTTKPAASTTPPPSKDGSWGWGPFFAGIAFAAGLSSVGYVLWRFYKVRTERNYHTL